MLARQWVRDHQGRLLAGSIVVALLATLGREMAIGNPLGMNFLPIRVGQILMPALAASAIGMVPSAAAESLAVRTPPVWRVLWAALLLASFHAYAWMVRTDQSVGGTLWSGALALSAPMAISILLNRSAGLAAAALWVPLIVISPVYPPFAPWALVSFVPAALGVVLALTLDALALVLVASNGFGRRRI